MSIDSEQYPFGVLQKVYVRVTAEMYNLQNNRCLNTQCNKKTKKDIEFCTDECYMKAHYESSVSGSWI